MDLDETIMDWLDEHVPEEDWTYEDLNSIKDIIIQFIAADLLAVKESK